MGTRGVFAGISPSSGPLCSVMEREIEKKKGLSKGCPTVTTPLFHAFLSPKLQGNHYILSCNGFPTVSPRPFGKCLKRGVVMVIILGKGA